MVAEAGDMPTTGMPEIIKAAQSNRPRNRITNPIHVRIPLPAELG
jgi:hypothetical protein